jgi:hypothetical protein
VENESRIFFQNEYIQTTSKSTGKPKTLKDVYKNGNIWCVYTNEMRLKVETYTNW